MVDARRSLQSLYDEWSKCTACELGVRRAAMGGGFVFGEGTPRGILFVGEGPTRSDEELSRPFTGPQGQLVHDMLVKLQFTDFYITNLVNCRACEPVIDMDTGLPQMQKPRRRGDPALPRFRDQVPLPTQIAACQKRLWEEIYIIDPVLIVTLGAAAATAVLGRNVAITKDRGRTEHCSFPGGLLRTVRTEKKQVWGRKVHGEYVLPTEPNEVRYLVLPTLHPSYVLRKVGDLGAGSPLRQFAEDMRKAVKIYERYMVEALNTEPTSTSAVDLSDMNGDLYDPQDENL